MTRDNSPLSLYNDFMKGELARIRAEQPDIDHKEVFKLVAANWRLQSTSIPPPPPSPPLKLPSPWIGEDPYCGFPPRLLPELSMMAASNSIREKSGWWQKYKDPVIAGRWRQEIKDASIQRGGGWVLREEQIDYIFKELDWYAGRRQNQVDLGIEAPVEVAIDCTRRSDGLIPSDLKERLLVCVNLLKDVPDHLKDWHPGSNKQVLDIIHPSLFPVIAGRTRVTDAEAIPPLDFIGQGKVLEELPVPDLELEETEYLSEMYQWLPTDVDVAPEGKVKIKSYINNLHPVEHREMYHVLEGIFERFLPMFEEVLGEISYIDDASRYRLSLPANFPIEIPDFKPREETIFDLKTRSPLQIIVKLANIELTPESPIYESGAWHVEGMANENIVATGIYYYHSENITESRLNFRIQVHEPSWYEQGDARGVELMYGLRDEEPLLQYLEGIVTTPDRCIVFPNIYQHQVQPFRVEDPNKPGIRSGPNKVLAEFAAEKVPPEIYAMIEKVVNWPMDLEEAKAHREELMKERKYFVQTNRDMFERPFSLCEH
ncbi:hypothetical protein BGZ68_004130 [Mortierella alpina]|nr:hypothetical protein BGZ68_004130 [Mortierella alpina]